MSQLSTVEIQDSFPKSEYIHSQGSQRSGSEAAYNGVPQDSDIRTRFRARLQGSNVHGFQTPD